jgi:hypothetical protein
LAGTQGHPSGNNKTRKYKKVQVQSAAEQKEEKRAKTEMGD